MQRLRKQLDRPGFRAAVRWLGPLGLAALAAVLLSPGQARLAEAPSAPKPARSAGAASPGLAESDAPPPPARFASLRPAPPEDAAEPDAWPRSGFDAPDEAGAPDPTYDCLIEPWEVVDLGSALTGVVERIHVERAELVEAGQLVAELEAGVEQAAVDVARARASMSGEVRARRASSDLSERRKDRVGELFQAQTLSLDLRDQAETEAEIARLELVAAEEDRRLASLELEQARQVLARRRIHTPIAGVVVDRLKAPGEVVDQETILTIAQLDPLRIEVILPSAMFGSVRPGTRAAIEPEFPGDRVHVASVEIVDRVIDAASGTFGVTLKLPNPEQEIPGGLHCQVRFLDE